MTRHRLIGIGAALLLGAGAPAAGGVMEGGERPAQPAGAAVPRAASLWVGFAEVLDLAGPVGTVVVGDSGLVEAAVVDRDTIVLTALAPGRTNVLVLGEAGGTLARLTLRIRTPTERNTAVFRGTERHVLVCDPQCRAPDAPALQPE